MLQGPIPGNLNRYYGSTGNHKWEFLGSFGKDKMMYVWTFNLFWIPGTIYLMDAAKAILLHYEVIKTTNNGVVRFFLNFWSIVTFFIERKLDNYTFSIEWSFSLSVPHFYLYLVRKIHLCGFFFHFFVFHFVR